MLPRTYLIMRVSRESLRPFQEVVGVYKGLRKTTENEITVTLSCRYHDVEIVFPAEGSEASILERELEEDLLGMKIGILKLTPKDERPIAIRIIETPQRQANTRTRLRDEVC